MAGRAPTLRDPLRAGVATLLLLVTALVLTVVSRADPDLWGHVQFGRDVLRTGRLPVTTTYTFTASTTPWINHENLAEITFAAAADVAGGSGLLVVRALLGLLVFGLLIRSALRDGASLVAVAIVMLLVSWNLCGWWHVRPQLFTMTLFAVMIAILDRGTTERPQLLWLLAPLFAVWVNAHGGFVAGYALLVLYLGCRGLEELWRHGRQARGRVLLYACIGAASGLATLVNPYGGDLLVWLLHDLVPPRPEISEWAPLLPSDPIFPFFAALAGLTSVAWLTGPRRRDFTHTVLLLVTAWQSIMHQRHLPFFVILAGFWLPAHLSALLARLRSTPKPDMPARPRPLVAASMVVAVVLLATALVGRMRVLHVDPRIYPVEAFAFMGRHGLVGKMVVYFDWAQYAIAAFAPDTRLSFDGRFRTAYPQEQADLHFDFILGDIPGKRWRSPTSPPLEPARTLEVGAPELVVIDRRSPPAVGVMRGRPDWVLLYQDGVAQVWGRRDRYDDPASPQWLAPERRSIGDRAPAGDFSWPALPPRAGAS